jgi:hypothetical protein
MIRVSIFTSWSGLAVLLLSTYVVAQVPEVGHTCVSGCGGGSGNSDARDRQLARNHAKHAQEVRWFNEVDGRWKSARKNGVKYTRKGIKEQGNGRCTAAIDDFQHELAAFSVDLTPRGTLVDAILGSKYQTMLYRQQSDISLARGRIADAQASCAPRQNLVVNRAPVSPVAPPVARVVQASAAAAPPNNAPPAPRNFVVQPETYGVTSCYRADPAKASCLELRNNSERRVRLYVDGLPGVQCTVEPHSYCSLPMAMGRLHLRMTPDDERGVGPIVESDTNVGQPGTRVTLNPAQ